MNKTMLGGRHGQIRGTDEIDDAYGIKDSDNELQIPSY